MPKRQRRQALCFTNAKRLKKSRTMRELRSKARVAHAGETVRVLEFASGEPPLSEMKSAPSCSRAEIAKDTRGRGLPKISSPGSSGSGSTPDDNPANRAQGASTEASPEQGNAQTLTRYHSKQQFFNC